MTDDTIDAKGKSLGRLASEIAVLLQGKNTASYEARKTGDNRVIINNIRLVRVTGKKAEQKIYHRYSNRPGHLKSMKYREVFARNTKQVLVSAVRGMLPRNKLLAKRIRR